MFWLNIWLTLQVAAAATAIDPFAFFQPTVTVATEERRQLDRGQSIARVLPGSAAEVAVMAAVPVRIDAERFIEWIRHIEALKRSDYVPAIGRFSTPPRLEDLASLSLDADDLSALRACRPQRCDVKIRPSEILQINRAIERAGATWQNAAQQAFREVMLARAVAYLALPAGATAAAARDTWPAEAYGRLVQRSAFLTAHLPALADDVREAPRGRSDARESFLYWSKERLSGKATVIITDVTIVRGTEAGHPDALIAGKQIVATHYLDASLGVTTLVRGAPGGPSYLVYLNRSEVDVLRGMFGGIVRLVAERRLKNEAARVLDGLRQRLESGPPPRAN